MFSLSMKLLRNEYKSAILFGITITLATTIVFLYLNVFYILHDLLIQELEPLGLSTIIGLNPAIIVVFSIICLCCTMLLLASRFYLNSKSKEYATLLLCGKNAIEVGIYSILQCIFIVIPSIILGIIVSYLLVPIINQGIYDYLGITNIMHLISSNAVKETSYIIFLVIVVTIIIFSGYAYRHTILQLMVNKKTSQGMRQTKKRKYLPYLCPFLLIPILTSENKPGGFLFPMFFGSIAIYLIYKNAIPVLLKKLRKEKGLSNSIRLLSLAHLGSTMQSCSLSSALIVITPVFLALLQGVFTEPRDVIVIFIGYQVVMILLIVSLLYQYMSSIPNRRHTFTMLSKIGYTKKNLKKAIKQEVFLFYSLLIILPNILPIFMLSRVYFTDIVLFNTICMGMASYIVLMLVSSLCITYYYQHILK